MTGGADGGGAGSPVIDEVFLCLSLLLHLSTRLHACLMSNLGPYVYISSASRDNMGLIGAFQRQHACPSGRGSIVSYQLAHPRLEGKSSEQSALFNKHKENRSRKKQTKSPYIMKNNKT